MVREIPDRRVAPRSRGQIPVEFGYGDDNWYDGLTQDFSTSGICFETEIDLSFSPGQSIEVVLLLEHYYPEQLVRLHCLGEVVRVKEKAKKIVAVTIRSFWFQDVQKESLAVNTADASVIPVP